MKNILNNEFISRKKMQWMNGHGYVFETATIFFLTPNARQRLGPTFGMLTDRIRTRSTPHCLAHISPVVLEELSWLLQPRHIHVLPASREKFRRQIPDINNYITSIRILHCLDKNSMTNQKLKAKFFRNSWALIFGLNIPFVANDSLKKNMQELFSAAKRLYCSTCVCIDYTLLG